LSVAMMVLSSDLSSRACWSIWLFFISWFIVGW
jgi:hypothetical protein